MGNGFSVAWRVLDACGWGVPQRRKRIYLVADFDGECAGKILFESEGLSGYSAESFRAWQRTAGDTENCSGTAGNGIGLNTVLPIENHPADSRMTISKDGLCQTLTSRCGTGGNNVPCLLAFGICSKASNAMLSDNPHSGFYEAETSRTLDTSDQSPTKNQGGMAVVYSASKTSFFTQMGTEQTASLVATDYKDPPLITEGMQFTVRRLTPQECARLQGFPDWWCSDLSSETPSDEEIDRWTEIFETFRKAARPDSKPKSRNAVIKWLRSPHSDSAEYKMWGNGAALPCVYFVLSGIAYYA